MVDVIANRQSQDLPRLLVIFAAIAIAVTVVGILAYIYWPSNDAPATPSWANQVLTVEDNPETEAVESGYSVRSVLYVEDVRAGDVAFAVNNLMGKANLRANDGGSVLLLVVTGQTEQTARAEAQRWQATVQGLLSGWRAQ